jgi:methyl-accepting chemotaxis protein
MVIVIGAGARDILFVSMGIQPLFWTSSMGMAVFILSTFSSSSMHTADLKSESEGKSLILIRQKESLREIFQDIKGIGIKVSESGNVLDRSVSETTTGVEDMVRSIEGIPDSITRVCKSTRKTKELSEGLSQFAEDGRRAVAEPSNAMSEIQRSSGSVREMSDKIAKGGALFEKVHQGLMKKIGGIGETVDLVNGISEASRSQQSDIDKITASIKTLVTATEEVKRQTGIQRIESEKIRASLCGLMKVAREIETATDKQAKG